ncbi:mitochondrial carrier [Cystobasidium minutum MCA 4210]|uniref:mitochondrial carrier n=1 Tax=Cystobasidium minutum MCA 4210 TaxID=1397322 RepID=UPI0034CF2254|eukprot:jgi/Rhomi1/50814/CE50813_410
MSGLDLTTILASSGSALVSRLTTHPLDTLRVRIQTYEGKSMPPLRQLIPKPWTGLYAGLPIALAFNVPGSCFYLTAYEACKSKLAKYLIPESSDGKPPSLLAQAPLIVTAALGAEVASGAIWTPMDVLKQRLQTGKESTKSAPVLIKRIWKEEGYRGVWRGYFFSLAQFGPYVSIYWLTYEALKTRFIPGYVASQGPRKAQEHPIFSLTTLRYTACSMGACALSVVLTNPVDIVQTRWQTSGGKITSDGLKESREGTLKDVFKHLWQTSGPRGFMRGVGIRIFYAIPANAIGMTAYESFKKLGVSWQDSHAGSADITN